MKVHLPGLFKMPILASSTDTIQIQRRNTPRKLASTRIQSTSPPLCKLMLYSASASFNT